MSSLLKDIYSENFYHALCDALEPSLQGFDRKIFMQRIFCSEFDAMELKQRMSHSINVIAEFLPTDYEQALVKICLIIENLRRQGFSEEGFEFMFLPEFIETRGIEHFQASLEALEFVTQFSSCEFAVRPFIQRYGQTMLDHMLSWTQHENHWVRRLASEGSRPRLPWAMALPALKKDPTALLPILESLKLDSSSTVRRSVANNLNDISKDNPDFVIALAKKWHGRSSELDALVKHACRSLLKQGETEVMKLFGYDASGIAVAEIVVDTPRVKFGEALEFSFSLHNYENERIVRIEYAIYHQKKNGDLSPKVFKISEREVETASTTRINRRHAIRPITTRRYYAGRHQLSIIVNGQESARQDFELLL